MRTFITILIAIGYSLICKAHYREYITLNDGWTIKPISASQRNAKSEAVTLPHTWNNKYTNGTNYNRETMVYQRELSVTDKMKEGKRLFLYFEGVNSVANVFVNYTSAGSHKGGYTAFCIEITDLVHVGSNQLEVWAGNAFRTDVLPISGDFNVQGGIHRPVRLIITSQDCIAPDFHASPGILITQSDVNERNATLDIKTILSINEVSGSYSVRSTVYDRDNNQKGIHTENLKTTESKKHSFCISKINIPKPHLWNGLHDPYLYKVRVELLKNGKVIDMIEQPLGIRYFSISADKGFFLNGKPYDLHGFNRHDDFYGTGSALTMKEYLRDIELIKESYATVVRLAHYPHGEPIYNLSDSAGVILWTEIPLCGPGGYLFTGFVNDVRDNAIQTLKEMIY